MLESPDPIEQIVRAVKGQQLRERLDKRELFQTIVRQNEHLERRRALDTQTAGELIVGQIQALVTNSVYSLPAVGDTSQSTPSPATKTAGCKPDPAISTSEAAAMTHTAPTSDSCPKGRALWSAHSRALW